MGRAYYNEIDPYAAQWLRNLIEGGHIAPGDVDERSIVDVRPADLVGYAQCHFFAGIGGWSYAARLAGWPDDKPLWTGSEPCQPYSVAGKGLGPADERYLRPHVHRLIAACRPAVYMGEQVAAAAGKDWLDRVHFDMESIGYACWPAVVPACAVNAPHRRDRLWFVAHSNQPCAGSERSERGGELGRACGDPSACDGELNDAVEEWLITGNRTRLDSLVDDADRERGQVYQDTGRRKDRGRTGEEPRPSGACDGPMAQSEHSGREGRPSFWRGPGAALPSSEGSWLPGADGKARRVEPGIRLLAHGVPARVGKLRAYGNAIVPQVAAEVIGAFLDIERAAA